MHPADLSSRDAVSVTYLYRSPNIFGSDTDTRVEIVKGHPLPDATAQRRLIGPSPTLSATARQHRLE